MVKEKRQMKILYNRITFQNILIVEREQIFLKNNNAIIRNQFS